MPTFLFKMLMWHVAKKSSWPSQLLFSPTVSVPYGEVAGPTTQGHETIPLWKLELSNWNLWVFGNLVKSKKEVFVSHLCVPSWYIKYVTYIFSTHFIYIMCVCVCVGLCKHTHTHIQTHTPCPENGRIHFSSTNIWSNIDSIDYQPLPPSLSFPLLLKFWVIILVGLIVGSMVRILLFTPQGVPYHISLSSVFL